MKKLFCILLAILAIFCAQAEHAYELTGTTAFLTSETVYAEIGGKLTGFSAMVGDSVQAGEIMGSVETMKVYASADGTVRGLFVEEGEHVSGEIFGIEPKEKYKLLASSSYAYDRPENALIHPGETVYASCVTDGTHLAIGYVADVDGEEFTVYTTHGNLYVGEAVVLYRDEGLSYTSRIARATVYAADVMAVEAEGTIAKLYISEGSRVEKGEILFEYILDNGAAAASGSIYASKSGVITAVHAADGDTISVSDALYEIAVPERYGVIVNVSEDAAASLSRGSAANALFMADETETRYPMTIITVSPSASESGGERVFEVKLVFDELPEALYAGMTVNVSF